MRRVSHRRQSKTMENENWSWKNYYASVLLLLISDMTKLFPLVNNGNGMSAIKNLSSNGDQPSECFFWYSDDVSLMESSKSLKLQDLLAITLIFSSLWLLVRRNLLVKLKD